jgi:hypothetical protein
MKPVRIPLIIAAMLVSSAVLAQEGGFLSRLGFKKSSELSETKISDGLREALSVGIDRTVTLVGKNDGYFKNEKIKIKPPKTVNRFDRALRAVGYGPELDEFVLSMNRAAEKAAPVAKDIFVKAISEMTIDDARAIFKGSDTAATDYLREHTRDDLTEAFLPHVKTAMAEYDVTAKYRAVTEQVSQLPFARGFGDDSIEKYTVGKALDGLFYMLGQEEKRIRTDPAARATDLLKTVFK